MAEYNEHTLTQAVVDRFGESDSERFKEVISAAIRHMHAFVKEVNLTPDEWFTAIEFLTATGQMCDDKRQEFILLSDVLGVSMMMEMVNNRRSAGETESTVLGPFHTDNAPTLEMGDAITALDGHEVVVMSGRVLDASGQPVAGARLDVWQAGPDGKYDVQKEDGVDLRGVFTSDDQGHYEFRTVKPEFYPVPTDGPVGRLLAASNRHPFRPAHIHFKITAQGYHPLITHLFVAGDNYLETDAVFAVRDSLIVDLTQADDAHLTATYDFVLAKEVSA